MAELEVRETVRQRYAACARAAAAGRATCCSAAAGPATCCSAADQTPVFGAALYGETEEHEAAITASLGCGVPTVVADLREGETVLDLGSGAGTDVLIAARPVGPTAWSGCVAGALTEIEFRSVLEAAGFCDVEVRETHRVHQHAVAAIVRARKPE